MFTFMQPVSEDITKDKYFLHGEKSVEEMFEGVATVASSLEKNKDLWKEIFYSEMIEGRLTPAGRILANARPNSPMRNYHNCFVIPIFDSMEDIYTALLEDSLIGKAGGGCVAKDSKVYVKDKGIIDIQEVEEGDLVYSFNIKTQTKEFKRVLQTHTPVVEKERQIGIVLSNNTKLITSKNHPTLVYKDGGFKYIPASEVKKYDLMLKFTFADIEANSSEDMSDIAWFVGAHLGDGSTDRVESHEFTRDYLGFGMNRKTCRLRISKSSFEVVQKYSEVLNKYSELNTSAVVENNPRWKVPMWGVHTEGTSVYYFIDKYIGQFSKKAYTMYIPKWIFTSSRETILGFIAGLIDTDGYVGGRRIEYSTASKQMQEDLLLLLSLLDVDYVLERARTSKGFFGCEPNNDTLYYFVYIEDRQFMTELLPYLVNKQRIEGVNTILASSQKVKMVVLDELLVLFEKYRAKKMLTKSVTPVTLHDISKVDEVVNKVMSRATKEDQKAIKYYYEIGKTLKVVKSIVEFPDVDTQFYDLTVEENNNYFAGIQGLSVIHNTGLNFSNLRPKGAKISKGGESSGVMSFMEVFNASAKSIHTGGNRRSAHLGVLNIDHPDIEEFITYKRGDENGKLTQFNISVGITDKFIDAVKKDADWDLVFEGKVYKTVKAKYLYNLITDNMFLYNEPGILYIDEVNRNNNGWYRYSIDSTNPCVTGDTLILTDRGNVPIESVVGQKVNIWNGFEYSEVEPRITGYDQEIYDIEFSNGSKLSCTPYHKFVLKDQSRIEAKDLKVDDTLSKWNFPIIEGKEELVNAYTQGFFSGDGYINQSDGRLGITLYNEKKELTSYLVYNSLNIQKDANTNGKKEKIFLNVSGLLISDKNFVPDSRYNINSRLEWFAGILDSDGTRNSKDGGIAISSVDYDFLISIKNMLMTLGVHSTISLVRDRKTSMMPDGNGGLKEYKVKKEYRIVVSAGMVTTLRGIGLTTHRVNIANNINRVSSRFVKVRSISKRSEREAKVYCVTEPKNHTVIFGGVMTSNCGEQPLPPYSSCCLSAINLSSLVKNQFTDKAEFDFNAFEVSVAVGVRFLDDILDVSEYPLDKIQQMVLSERRIGLGYTGLGDMLAKMCIPYGSPESMELCERIATTFRDSSYLASIQLAKEKGAFPMYDEKLMESGFIQRLPEHIKEGIREHGLRNVALNTVAPNGTISLSIGNNCSSGIEPIFALEYTRNVRQPDDTFVPQKVYNKAWLEYLQYNGEPKEIPPFFKTADEITLDESVNMQALWQKYIDASISKTITLPDDCTIEGYRDLFMKTYDAKLKGYTTYNPKGYLKPILTKEEKKDAEVKKEEIRYAKKRPDSLPCDIYEMMVNKKRMVVLVGLMNYKPYEVFLTEDPDNTINVLKEKQGTIQKVKISKELSRYDLHITGKKGEFVLQNITQVFDDDYAIMCRLASLYMRHENPLQFLVEQLNRTKGFDTFSKTLYRVLKKYLDGEVVLSSHAVCPDCGGKLQYIEGCVTCQSCGYSKC